MIQHYLPSSWGLLWCIVSFVLGYASGYTVRFVGYNRAAPTVFVEGDDIRIAIFSLFSQCMLIVVWWSVNAIAFHELEFRAGWWPVVWMIVGCYGIKQGYRIGVHRLLPPVTNIPEE